MNIEPTKPKETKTSQCDIHGEYKAGKFTILDRDIWTKCPKCIEASAEKEKAKEKEVLDREAQKRAKEIEKNLVECGLIKRYRGIKLDSINPTPDQEKALRTAVSFTERFNEMSEKGQNLIFCGTVGTGKTMLVHAIMQTLGFGYYIRAIDISRRVRNTYSNGESELEAINNLVGQDLLVIDEVGVQQDTKNESLLITDLIDRRYGDMKPTIICSNLNEQGLSECFGARAWDRIMQNGAIIPMTGKSNRGNL